MGEEILGVDVGGVILDFARYLDTELDFRGDRYLETPELQGAIDAIASLNQGAFKDRVYLVSKIEEKGENRGLEWLRHHKFFERTGMPENHYYTCYERSAKAPICRNLGITHFVDDRAEVLGHLVGIVANLYQFRPVAETETHFADAIPNLHRVESWPGLLKELQP